MDRADELRGSLAEFFLGNPNSVYQATDDGGVIERPWSDDTLQISVKDGDQELIQSLNSVYLPPRFTAIWHKDTKDIEFIWTITSPDNPYLSRSFEFRFQDRTYRCEFGDTSTRLLALANAAMPVAPPTATQYRNLFFIQSAPAGGQGSRAKPSSFWIRDVKWDETRIVELALHINFYMSLYDPSSPFIMIHAPDISSRPPSPAAMPSLFPQTIVGRRLDLYLLLLWETARTREPFLQFLYLYQILEYAAFYYLDVEVAAKVKRLLASPDAMLRVDETIHGLIEAVVDLRGSDEAKIAAVIKLVIEPDSLWPSFEVEATSFSSGVTFDGGFSLVALINEGWGLDDFRTGGFPKVADYYRKMRNALSHGREKRMTDVIYPTERNAALLGPWLLPLRRIAAHAILYESM